ncbi:ABC transporter permease [Bacteroidales bacterium]|nr:ABC transporter permease [Bacteroidales bacterium]
MLKFIINNAIRNLKSNYGSSLINIFGLAFGFACALLIYLHVHHEKTCDSALPEHERIYCLLEESPNSRLGNMTISYAVSPLLAEKYPEIEHYARTENFSRFSNCIVWFKDKGEIKSFNERDFYIADSSLFKIMQFTFTEGNRETAFTAQNSIVLTQETAHRYFGNESALGKTLTLNKNKNFTVTGVIEMPNNVSLGFPMVARMDYIRKKSKLEGWDGNGQPYFKLHKDVDIKAFNQKIENFYAELNPEQIRNPEQIKLSMFPIIERQTHYQQQNIRLLMFLCIVVMVVAALNYVNMSTSIVQKRSTEIALKKIVGAGKRSVQYLFLAETMIVCFVAFFIGLVLARVGASFFGNLIDSNLVQIFQTELIFILNFTLVIWITTTLLTSIYPSLVLSNLKPITLFGKGKKTSMGNYGKSALLTFQFAISITLVIFTIMIAKQNRFMQQIPLGLNTEFVVQVPFSQELKQNFRSLKSELQKSPFVNDVCAASTMPVAIENHSGITWTDDNGEEHNQSFGFAIVSDGYTQVFDMQISEGNEFDITRKQELNGIIINEEAARILGYKNPIGQPIHFWGKHNKIIGIVKDFQNNYLFSRIKPMVISAHPQNQEFTKHLFVSVNPQNATEAITYIEKVTKQFSPTFPFEHRFTNQQVENYINNLTETNATFKFAGIISILIALAGLMSLTYHTTLSRVKEVGIRKVNGARRSEILTLLNGSFLKWVILSFFIASPVSWLVIDRMFSNFGYRTTTSWWVFAIAGTFICALALITVSWQSWRAANKNPVEALRYE